MPSVDQIVAEELAAVGPRIAARIAALLGIVPRPGAAPASRPAPASVPVPVAAPGKRSSQWMSKEQRAQQSAAVLAAVGREWVSARDILAATGQIDRHRLTAMLNGWIEAKKIRRRGDRGSAQYQRVGG